jgi:hypothetical protein
LSKSFGEKFILGRPEKVQVIFGRKLQKKTVADGRLRTRIITDGVIPSLHVYYKNTHLKQYHKQVQSKHGLRTNTTVNDTYDFGVGRPLCNLPKLREIGFTANRRLLKVEKLSHDCQVGAEVFEQMQKPVELMANMVPRCASAINASGDDDAAIDGFRKRPLRPLLAQYLCIEESAITAGRMSHELRRLRLHGLIERIQHTHRYRLLQHGLRTCLFYSRLYARVIRPGLAILHDPQTDNNSPSVARCANCERLIHLHRPQNRRLNNLT